MRLKIKFELEDGETPASLARDCRSDDGFRCPCNRVSFCPFAAKDEHACKSITAERWRQAIKNGFEIREGKA